MAEYMSERELRKRRRDNIRESEERRELLEWEERRRMEIEEMIQIELEENRQRMELEQRTQMGLEESPQMMEMEERTQVDNQDSRQWPKREKREIVKLGERSPLEAGERRHDLRSNLEESETRSVRGLQGDESVFRAIDEASCSTEMLQDTTFLLKDRKRVKEQDSLSIETRKLDLLLQDIECLGEQYSFMSQQGDRVQDETVKKKVYSDRTVIRDVRNDKGALKEDYSRDQDTERLREGEPDAYEMHDQTFTFDKRHHESLADRYRQEEESIERLIREKQREKQRELELETYRRELEEERFLLEKERRKRAEEEQNRKFESTWSVEKELREMEKRRREQEYEKIKIEEEQQMRQKVLEDKERRDIEFRIQQSRLQKEQRREKEKMHAIMIYEEKIKAEKEREHRKRMLEIQMQKEMEVICIDYLSLERSKGGFEDILVITDHFSRYAQAYPTKNQTAKTTAKVLFENFIVHYGFPARIHSDQGQNFESNLIRELCQLAGIEKSRTTPYHAMGNGMVERFNQTLLKMLGTLEEHQKADWKSHIPTLVHAYNATHHESTGFSPYFLMFGRHPRLAIDALLGLPTDSISAASQSEYVVKLRDRLQAAYQKAREISTKVGQRNKRHYDEKARSSALAPGDRVLVRNVSIRGKQKLADRWENVPYIVISQPNPDIPVYEVKKEGTRYKKSRTLHRNMLLPFMSTTDVMDEEGDGNDSAASRPYVIPMLRPEGTPGLLPRTRPRRSTRKPDRYGDFAE